jgi:hypothetical protein
LRDDWKERIIKKMKTVMKAGRYYVGDPCYMFDDNWGVELEAEGKVSLCCGGEAATFIGLERNLKNDNR